MVGPYFEAVAEWLEAVRIGRTGGALEHDHCPSAGRQVLRIFLNPGHQIHLDEWVNSPVGPGSKVELRSGMALQVDIIPATGTDYFTTNIEDGIALADATLRADLEQRYPKMWQRMTSGARSWPTHSASSCMPTSCHCQIWPVFCRRSSFSRRER